MVEVMGRMGAQNNQIFKWWHEIQRRNAAFVKTYGPKTSRLFEKVGNIAQPAEFCTTVTFRNILILF